MIRIGILGAGKRAHGHLQMLKPLAQAGRCQLSAVWDPVVPAREELARDCGAQAVGGLEDLLKASDAVIVISPNRFHVEQSIACLEAGKHVYCEKPLALTVADADRVVAAVERTRQLFMTGFSIRWSPVAWHMRRLLDEGCFGKLLAVTSRRIAGRKGGDDVHQSGWRADAAQTGGVLAEILAHELDWLRWVGGEVVSVTARTFTYQTEAPPANDHVVAQLHFANGGVGTLEGGWRAFESEYHKSLFGSQGAAITRDWQRELWVRAAQDAQSAKLELAPSPSSDEVFIEAIEKGRQPPSDVHDGRAIVALTEAVHVSAAEGRSISIK